MIDSPEPPPSVETQLAVLRVKMDQLIDLNKTRGEDHESRIRRLEERKFPLPTVAVLIALASIISNIILYVVK